MRFMTPEEMMVRKKRNKTLLYAGIFLGMIILSAALTVLTSQV